MIAFQAYHSPYNDLKGSVLAAMTPPSQRVKGQRPRCSNVLHLSANASESLSHALMNHNHSLSWSSLDNSVVPNSVRAHF